jgi:hypothetical protein
MTRPSDRRAPFGVDVRPVDAVPDDLHRARLHRWARAAVLGALALGPAAATAWELQGTKQITALTRDQQRVPLGSVRFEPQDGGRVAFKVQLDPTWLRDHFLSMREFKCLEGPAEIACHVPYPHPQPGTVTAGDLAWLEHSLLFLFKLPSDFGAKLWNGLYFQLERGERGLVGRPQAIDLDRISTPPAEPDVPPYRPALRDDIRPGARWIEALLIE